MSDSVFAVEKEEEQKIKRHSQDVRINETINGTRTMIGDIRKDEDIAAILAEHGYGEERLDDGLARSEHCRSTFHDRSAAITAQQRASSRLFGLEETARRMYADFRLTARGLFPEEEVQAELGLIDRVPKDRTKLLGIARLSVDAARREPYAARFAEFGYDTAMLESLEAALDALDDADNTQNTAIIAAIEATKIRDKAYAKLTEWLQQFRKVATAALRSDPEKLKILKV
jgi:hypothetical protein